MMAIYYIGVLGPLGRRELAELSELCAVKPRAEEHTASQLVRSALTKSFTLHSVVSGAVPVWVSPRTLMPEGTVQCAIGRDHKALG
jgi:hypothetical protein